jgi:Protein of unknown function DUF262
MSEVQLACSSHSRLGHPLAMEEPMNLGPVLHAGALLRPSSRAHARSRVPVGLVRVLRLRPARSAEFSGGVDIHPRNRMSSVERSRARSTADRTRSPPLGVPEGGVGRTKIAMASRRASASAASVGRPYPGSMPESLIHFNLEGIAHLLRDRLLAVPIYQRSYSWGKDEVKDFWDDLSSTLPRASNEYFLGTIVLSKEGRAGRETIIDGQQRLATTAILLSAIRDEFRGGSDAARAEILEASYLAKPDLASAEGVPQICLNNEDDTYFRQTILGIDSSAARPVATRHSHNLIADAYDYLRARAKETADAAAESWRDRLLAWVNYLTDSVAVMVVEVPTEADAFMIFETLNARGADLTIADLLKNYVFGRSGARLDVVRDAWLRSLGALEITAENSLFTTFLRHYWSSKYGATRERDLYRAIKETIQREAEVVAFAEELSKSAVDYAALLNSDHEVWSALGTAGRGNVESVLRLNLEQNRPLLLAALQHMSRPELSRLLRAVVAWSVRGLIVGGIGGGTTERAYCEAAVKIRRREIADADGGQVG